MSGTALASAELTRPWLSYEQSLELGAARAVTATADVSVVIPSYNGSRYLQATLDCISRQTVRPAEVIVVDDGSIDDSAKVAERFGARVVRLSRAGVCEARNRGVREATSSWIAFLDHDDLWLPTKIESQFAAIERYPDAVLVTTDVVKIDGDDQLLLDSFLHSTEMNYDGMTATETHGVVDYFPNARHELRHAGWFLLPSAVLARRDALLQVGIFDERVRLNEDVSCFLRLAMIGALAVVDEALTGWRIHASNTHHNQLGMMRGRLALCRVAMAERDAYPDWFVTEAMASLPALMQEIGRTELQQNNPAAARTALRQAIREGAGIRPAALWLGTFLGTDNFERIAQRLRKFRRA